MYVIEDVEKYENAMVKVERPPQISRKDDLQLNDVKKMS
jgi:hypothetical protein